MTSGHIALSRHTYSSISVKYTISFFSLFPPYISNTMQPCGALDKVTPWRRIVYFSQYTLKRFEPFQVFSCKMVLKSPPGATSHL